jgi:hypothetical protein
VFVANMPAENLWQVIVPANCKKEILDFFFWPIMQNEVILMF